MNEIKYFPQTIANHFLEKRNHNINLFKLNKLVYEAYGCALVILNRKIFDNPVYVAKEDIYNGKNIPVIGVIFNKIIFDNINNPDPIVGKMNISPLSLNFKNGIFKHEIHYKDDDLKDLMDCIFENYVNKGTLEATHNIEEKETPWYGEEKLNNIIPNDVTKKYFMKMLKKCHTEVEENLKPNKKLFSEIDELFTSAKNKSENKSENNS
jgi:uncharacterized phage-associated protein